MAVVVLRGFGFPLTLYDQLNRLTQKTYPDGTSVNYTYGGDPRVTGAPAPRGRGGIVAVGRKLALVSVLWLLIGSAAIARSSPEAECENFDSLKIVKVDDRAARVFVEARLDQINTRGKAQKILLAVQKSLKECRPNWGSAWSVSFFSDRKYAGYKHESRMEPFVQDGSWFREYVGEYDHASSKLTLSPLEPNKIKYISIRLP